MDLIFRQLLFLLVLNFLSCVYCAPQPGPQRSAANDYTVTHLDIRDAVLSLVRVLQDQMDKLERHEGRERQLGEQLTRSLSILEKRSRGEEKNIENIASFVGKIDEKVKFMQATMEKQTDERKMEHEVTGLEFKGLKQLLAESSRDAGVAYEKIDRKMESIAEKLEQLRESSERNRAKFDNLVEVWKTMSSSSSSSSSDISEALLSEISELKDLFAKNMDSVSNNKQNSNSLPPPWFGELLEGMDGQRKQLALLEEEISKTFPILSQLISSSASIDTKLGQFSRETSGHFTNFQSSLSRLEETSSKGDKGVERGVDNGILSEILEGQFKLSEGMKETSAKLGGLWEKVENGYGKLADEMKGLSNVESVLLDTGDSVLDTKRRLEYGVQQILGELNSQMKDHTSNLNSSIQLRFDGLATAVLGNQSRAIGNLTSRMEEDIAGVWRQIGTLYHEMTRSASLLTTIHSQTSKYVNNSLDTMSSMDGKVGEITNRMGEVDDNLNYLLGRMSLVVQEFNQIKQGLGDALNSLKDSFSSIAEFDNKIERKLTNNSSSSSIPSNESNAI